MRTILGSTIVAATLLLTGQAGAAGLRTDMITPVSAATLVTTDVGVEMRPGGAARGGRAGRPNRSVNVNRNVNRNVTRNRNVNVNVNRPGVGRPGVGRPGVVRPVIVQPWRPRPHYGTLIAGVALGTLVTAAAVGSVPAAPASNVCWYWADSSMVQGYWDYCR